MRKLAFVLITGAVLVIPGVSLAGGGGGGPCPQFAEGQLLAMEDNCFAGVAHFAAEGETLTIRNNGRWAHTFTSVDGLFDTGDLQSGETYDLAGLDAGVYRVVCTLHGTSNGDGMAGVLIVGEPADAAGAAAVRTGLGGASSAPAAAAAADPALAAAVAEQAAAIAALSAAADDGGSGAAPIGMAAGALAVAIAALAVAAWRRPARGGRPEATA